MLPKPKNSAEENLKSLARPLAALNSSVTLGQLVNQTFKIAVDRGQYETREEEYSIWAAKLRL